MEWSGSGVGVGGGEGGVSVCVCDHGLTRGCEPRLTVPPPAGRAIRVRVMVISYTRTDGRGVTLTLIEGEEILTGTS